MGRRRPARDPAEVLREAARLAADPDPLEREKAANSIEELEEWPPEAVAIVRALLKDSNRLVRRSAPSSFGFGKGKELVPDLIEGLSDPEPTVRAMMADALHRVLWRDDVPLELIERMCGDADALVRRSGYGCLQAGPKDSSRAVELLIQGLDDSFGSIRMLAAWGLMTRGRRARAALPALRAARRKKGQHWKVRFWMSCAIDRVRFPWISLRFLLFLEVIVGLWLITLPLPQRAREAFGRRVEKVLPVGGFEPHPPMPSLPPPPRGGQFIPP